MVSGPARSLPLVFLLLFAAGGSAGAFSQIGSTSESGSTADPSKEGIVAVPLPPLQREAPRSEGQAAERSATELNAGPVFYSEENLPEPVRELRRRLMEIARSGEIEALRPYIETGEHGTVLSFGGEIEDPIAFLKRASGDAEGTEILAILLEVLESGYVHQEPGTPNEIYVWPYFTRMQMDALTKPQKVELFELITASDYENMKAFGAYNFYRIGITPDGRLRFFVAGD